MENPRAIYFYLLLVLSLFITISAKNDCLLSPYGIINKTFIRFPFKIRGYPNICGYPGFGITITTPDYIPTVDLPSSGEFSVRYIDYLKQEIQLYDPLGCLPKRLISLNLSSSPFTATHYRNYTFLSCSPEVVVLSNKSTAIGCMSNSNATILATSSLALAREMNMCTIMFEKPIPVTWPDQKDHLTLSWNLPGCVDCEKRGVFCGFANATSTEIACFDVPKPGTPRPLITVIIIAFCVLPSVLILGPLLYLVLYSVYKRAKENRDRDSATARRRAAVAPQPPTFAATTTAPVAAGLDDSAIGNYEKVVLGESLRIPGRNDRTCSICIAEYSPRDTIICMPDCQHCFHAACIDEWLRMNATCPVCRSSQARTNV